MIWNEEPSSSGEEGPPVETDDCVSPKQRRRSVDLDAKPTQHHGDLTLVPGFELSELVQTSLAEGELIQLAKTEQSLTLNRRHLGRRSTGSVD